MRDAGLGVHLLEVEDGDPGGLAAGAAGGGDRNQWLESPGHWLPATDGWVDISKEIGGVRCVQVRGFGGVHTRAAAHRDEAIESASSGEADRILERAVSR